MHLEPALSENPKPKKNTLSLRLTESAVFISTDVHPRSNGEQRSTPLRGLLILHLVKPTKITSIEAELTATSCTSWPEGIGARRVDVNEEHRVFHTSMLYFRASKSHARRTASIGPGIHYDNTNYDDDWDDSSRAHEAPIHTTASAASPSRRNGYNEINTRTFPPSPPSRSLFRDQRINRNASHSQRTPLHETDEGITDLHMQQLAPIPPYSPFAHPISNLEDPRHSLYPLRGRTISPAISRSNSVIPEDDVVGSGIDVNPSTTSSRLTLNPTSSPTLTSLSPSSPLDTYSPTSASTSTSQHPPRGRKRFNLSTVSDVIDAVRSGSPRTFGQSREREYEGGRERSVDTIARGRRGRTMERGSDLAGDDLEKDSKLVKEKGRGIIAMMMGDRDKEEKEKERAAAEGWKEFKKGTYTFPISFSIPGNAPATMTCDYGSVTWRLKAIVHRPGAFKAKMTAVREVITVACPSADDTEDTESVIVERHWDQQLQYLICVSGRSFYVGGTVPVTFTLMPLAKINIHRLSVFMEERVDYYTNMKRIARTDPIARFTLLSIKGDDNRTPILPLRSDDPDALRHSPLFALVEPGDDLSEVASNLMGPGPWTLHQDLKLPASCSLMKFSNKNRQSNIIVTHTLKLVMRVERGDNLFMDGKTGKRKLFDIVVQTPVLILSCRCNPEWTCLPRYSEVLDGSTAIVPSCPCRASHLNPDHISSPIELTPSRYSSDSSASAAETSPVSPLTMASLRQLQYNEAILRSSSLFERLVSGQESVRGEVPPAYDIGSRPATNGVAAL